LFFCMFQDLWNKKKFEKFLVEILQYTKLAWKRNRFVFGLHSGNMDGSFWNLVCIGHCIIENENRVTGRLKILQECKNGDFWVTGRYIYGCWATE
jgi:hypothetical protein